MTRRVSAAGLRQRAQFAHQGADAAAELERAAGAIAFPEGHLAGLAGSGRDQHAVVRDVDDAPGGCAEDEGLVGMRLEDHLLVELADAHGFAFAVGEEDAVEAAVGNGAGVEDGEARGAVARGDHVADAVPGEARAQLGELVGGVAAAEQIEHAFEGGARERAEGRGAADEVEEGVDADFGLGAASLRLRCSSRRIEFVRSEPCVDLGARCLSFLRLRSDAVRGVGRMRDDGHQSAGRARRADCAG